MLITTDLLQNWRVLLIHKTNKITDMKKVVVASMAILLAIAVFPSNAQTPPKEIKSERKALRKLEGAKVSEIAKSHFSSDFRNVSNPSWKRSVQFDEVTFIKDGQEMTAFYDYDANLVGTTTHKTFKDLPANGQKEIQDRYKYYTIGPVILFDDNEANETDMILWGNQFEDQDNYFVELANAKNKVILEVSTLGNVSLFKQL
jgi:hypothetical protein